MPGQMMSAPAKQLALIGRLSLLIVNGFAVVASRGSPTVKEWTMVVGYARSIVKLFTVVTRSVAAPSDWLATVSVALARSSDRVAPAGALLVMPPPWFAARRVLLPPATAEPV